MTQKLWLKNLNRCGFGEDFLTQFSSYSIVLSVSAGIGDGGNELGMGKLIEKVKSSAPNGNLIACDVPADYAITAGMHED